jgi:histidine ammonia-lyase
VTPDASDPGQATLGQLEQIWRDGEAVVLDASAMPGIEAAAALVRKAAEGDEAVYGVNTGFGKLASVRIKPGDTATAAAQPDPVALLRRRRAARCRHHAADDGAQAAVAGRGASGITWKTLSVIQDMLAKGVTPVIPSQGSVGASGDLAPLAHMAAAMIGEGEASLAAAHACRRSAGQAGHRTRRAGPEGRPGLINGTQFSTACALVGCSTHPQCRGQLVSSCLSTDAIMGSTAPLKPGIHAFRGHRGQIDVASAMRAVMEGSVIRESHRDGRHPCAGSLLHPLPAAGDRRGARSAAVCGADAGDRGQCGVSDNPLVLVEEGKIVSGGNFHAEPVAFAADQIALAIAEIGAIAQRRVALMVDPTLSFDLPPFLTPEPGLNSGLMIAEVTTAALMSENKHLANPCSTDSTPTSANQEDHVSMAAHGARRLSDERQSFVIIGVELLCAAQGVEFRAPLDKPGASSAIDLIRADCHADR